MWVLEFMAWVLQENHKNWYPMKIKSFTVFFVENLNDFMLFQDLCQTLMTFLEEKLGDKFSLQTAESWRVALQTVCSVIREEIDKVSDIEKHER